MALQGSKPLTEHITLASMFKNGYAVIIRHGNPGSATTGSIRSPRRRLGRCGSRPRTA